MEIVKLEAELVDAPPIASNLAELQRQCLDLAQEYRLAGKVENEEDYRQAKRDRAAVNSAYKQVEDERKRVKTAWMAPYATFEAGVKGSLLPLVEVKDRIDAGIKAYEARARDVKRQRLREYWETNYPALALCTGEASEPLVPFERVFDHDWIKRISELGDDRKPREEMDGVANRLARAAQVIKDRTEPEEVKRYGLSELYRTLDSDAAQTAMVEEARRQRDIKALEESPDVPGIPSMAAPDAGYDPEPEPEAPEEPEPVKEPQKRVYYVVTIECETVEEAARVRKVMQEAHIKGRIEKVEV